MKGSLCMKSLLKGGSEAKTKENLRETMVLDQKLKKPIEKPKIPKIPKIWNEIKTVFGFFGFF